MANTRITQGVIKPNEDYDVRHINATGIITATNLNLTGVLTYEDVTNVDSIGIITARKGIVSSGVVTATAFHGDGSNLTGVDSTALKDPAGNVKIQAQASGAMHTGFSTMQNLRVTGIATFGSGSTTIDNNVINVGTALTLGHTQGLQFHTQNLHSAGFEINQINASGIITASSFSGDGSNLTSLPAGLGTALSSTQSSPLNKIYYTNTVLPVNSTVTVDTPASASAAYTQYADISVGSGADLIISDGDDLIPDVLGLRPDGTFGGGSLGRMRVDKLVGKDANSAVNVEKGLVISGVTTATGAIDLNADLDVDGHTNLDNVSIAGVSTFASAIDLNGDLDVDGHLNADNVSISGISSTGNIYITTGGDGRKLSFAGDGSSHYIKMDHTLNGPIINGYGGIAFETNGTNERLRIGSAGQLGIGGANYGTSGQVLKSQGSGSAVQWASPSLAMADQWRVSTSQTTSSDTIADITAWSRNNNNFAGVGSALTNSGANFTFPSNGIYYVSYNIATYITSGSARYISARLYFAGQDICHSWGSAHHGAGSGQTLQSVGSQAILDVTNASTQTFKIRIQSSVPVVVVGLNEAGYNSSVNMSEVVVMRIGDT